MTKKDKVNREAREGTLGHPIILITGGTGFAGSHLVEELIKRGYKNIHVTAFGTQNNIVHSLIPANNVHQLDLTKEKPTFELIKKIKPDHIYHLAALSAVGSSFDKIKFILKSNLELQLNILNAIKKYAPKSRNLIIGSALEYKPSEDPHQETDSLGPISPYAVSKVLQDTLSYSYAKTYNLDIVIARPFNHIGERQAPGFVVSDFASQIVKIERGQQTEIKVGNLKATRDFTDVHDMVKAYILLIEKGKSGEIYNIGSGKGYSIQEILDTLCQLSNTKVKIETDQDKYRPIDVPKIIADNSKIKKLGWQTQVDIEDTLERILNWWRTNN